MIFRVTTVFLQNWIPQVKKQCPPTLIILTGSKIDFREKEYETVTTEMGKLLTREINAVGYFECSCCDGKTTSLERVFKAAAQASYFVKVKKFFMKRNKTLFKVRTFG